MLSARAWCLLVFLAMFSSCKKKCVDHDASGHWNSKRLEAKLYDVPVLINAQLVQNINNTEAVDESSIISYETTVDYDQVCTFYQEEMEKLGWWQSAAFEGSESLLNFEKPNKYCSISIRPLKKTSHVIMFIGQRT